MSFDSLGRSEVIRRRLMEFRRLGEEGETLFDFRPFLDLKIKATIESELAFCISTANSSAIAGLRFQKSLEGLDLRGLDVERIEELMKNSGVRFYTRKAKYVKMAIENFRIVERALKMDDFSARKEIMKLKGLGMKESSHFLRNVGRLNLAIVDRHVLRWLEKRGFKPKNYLMAEEILRRIAEEEGITLAELDLRIWFEMTGKVLK